MFARRFGNESCKRFQVILELQRQHLMLRAAVVRSVLHQPILLDLQAALKVMQVVVLGVLAQDGVRALAVAAQQFQVEQVEVSRSQDLNKVALAVRG